MTIPIIIDKPNLSATIEEWEEFLSDLEKPPRNEYVDEYIKDAKRIIANKKAGEPW